MTVTYRRFQNLFWIVCILVCYPLYAAGQVWLFLSKQKENDFYLLINRFPGDWINAHLLLMAGIVLMIPAFVSIARVVRNRKNVVVGHLSVFFMTLGVLVLFGQYTIDLCIPALFKLPAEQGYAALDQIQNSSLIKSIFYDNSRLILLFKYFDLVTISQLLLWTAMILSGMVPRWALVLYFVVMLLTQFGILIDPFWGRIIKRSGYALFSIAFLPLVAEIYKNKPSHLVSSST